ncbi:family 78 glycoside hydrolase catalytic domain [Coraliomargarita sp. W4R72]
METIKHLKDELNVRLTASSMQGGETQGWWLPFDEAQSASNVVMFRKKIPPEVKSGEINIAITCNGTYRLWWNGEFVRRGPSHSGTEYKRIDQLKLPAGSSQGENELRIECIWFPYKTAFCPPSNPGLWCRLERGAAQVEIDETWECREHPSYRKNTVRRSPALTSEEHYDARKESLLEGDGWLPPESILGQTATWAHLIDRGIPDLAEALVRPVQVLKTAEVSPEEFSPDSWPGYSIQSLAVHLLKEMPETHTVTRVENSDSLCHQDGVGTTVIQPSWLDPNEPNQKNTTIILDFGCEQAAYFFLDVEGNEGAVVDIAYSEFLKYGRVPALTHQVNYADRYTLREGRQTHEINDWKGFRYVQLTLRHLTRPLTIHTAAARSVQYSYENRDAFSTKDDTLNQIWEICDYGRRICSQDRFIDCPWREQAPWLLDAWLAAKTVYGDPRLRAKTIEDFLLSQNSNGSFPTASYSSSFCHDQSFTLAPLIEQQFCETGDMVLLEAALPALRRFHEWIDTQCNADGLIENIGPVHLDWAHFPDKSGCLCILNALYAWSLPIVANLAEKLGDKELQAASLQRYQQLCHAIRERFWDASHRMYRDSLAEAPHFSQHAQAICCLAGVHEGDRANLLLRAAGEPADRISKMNLYFAVFWIEALTAAGLRQEAFDYIRRVWGRMVEDGATTPWEIEQRFGGYFHPGYWHIAVASSCHGGYASYPQYWLQREVLGIHGPDLEGRISIRPGCELVSSAEGTVHLPGKVLRVAWDAEIRTISLEGIDPACCVLPAGWAVDGSKSPSSFPV